MRMIKGRAYCIIGWLFHAANRGQISASIRGYEHCDRVAFVVLSFVWLHRTCIIFDAMMKMAVEGRSDGNAGCT